MKYYKDDSMNEDVDVVRREERTPLDLRLRLEAVDTGNGNQQLAYLHAQFNPQSRCSRWYSEEKI
jgi:hypothetical protein